MVGGGGGGEGRLVVLQLVGLSSPNPDPVSDRNI